jgi:hypothetical protein
MASHFKIILIFGVLSSFLNNFDFPAKIYGAQMLGFSPLAGSRIHCP